MSRWSSSSGHSALMAFTTALKAPSTSCFFSVCRSGCLTRASRAAKRTFSCALPGNVRRTCSGSNHGPWLSREDAGSRDRTDPPKDSGVEQPQLRVCLILPDPQQQQAGRLPERPVVGKQLSLLGGADDLARSRLRRKRLSQLVDGRPEVGRLHLGAGILRLGGRSLLRPSNAFQVLVEIVRSAVQELHQQEAGRLPDLMQQLLPAVLCVELRDLLRRPVEHLRRQIQADLARARSGRPHIPALPSADRSSRCRAP
eukprot:scaffold368_cov258-Pinguiococcus_pyrenoidosus.AAC.16